MPHGLAGNAFVLLGLNRGAVPCQHARDASSSALVAQRAAMCHQGLALTLPPPPPALPCPECRLPCSHVV